MPCCWQLSLLRHAAPCRAPPPRAAVLLPLCPRRAAWPACCAGACVPARPSFSPQHAMPLNTYPCSRVGAGLGPDGHLCPLLPHVPQGLRLHARQAAAQPARAAAGRVPHWCAAGLGWLEAACLIAMGLLAGLAGGARWPGRLGRTSWFAWCCLLQQRQLEQPIWPCRAQPHPCSCTPRPTLSLLFGSRPPSPAQGPTPSPSTRPPPAPTSSRRRPTTARRPARTLRPRRAPTRPPAATRPPPATRPPGSPPRPSPAPRKVAARSAGGPSCASSSQSIGLLYGEGSLPPRRLLQAGRAAAGQLPTP